MSAQGDAAVNIASRTGHSSFGALAPMCVAHEANARGLDVAAGASWGDANVRGVQYQSKGFLKVLGHGLDRIHMMGEVEVGGQQRP